MVAKPNCVPSPEGSATCYDHLIRRNFCVHSSIDIDYVVLTNFRLVTAEAWLFLLLILFAQLLSNPVLSKDLPDVYWNSSNPIFRVDNTDHVISVRIRDRLNIRCPYFDQEQLSASASDLKQIEYSEIYSVSRWQYDNCKLDESAKIAGVCIQPFKVSSPITIVFREFTPKPGGLEFKPGQNYYFISTSTGSLDGIQNKEGGLCSSQNMKVKIEVADITSEEKQSRQTDQFQSNHVDAGAVWSGQSWDGSEGQASRLGNNQSRSGDAQSSAASGRTLPRLQISATTENSQRLYVIHTRAPSAASVNDHDEHGSYVINEEYYPGGHHRTQSFRTPQPHRRVGQNYSTSTGVILKNHQVHEAATTSLSVPRMTPAHRSHSLNRLCQISPEGIATSSQESSPEEEKAVLGPIGGEIIAKPKPKSYRRSNQPPVLTEVQKSLLKFAWNHLGKRRGSNGIGTIIFTKIFKRCPDARSLFSFGDSVTWQYEPDFERHSRIFVSVLDNAVKQMDDLHGAYEESLHKLGRFHATLKAFKPEYWDVFAEALMESFLIDHPGKHRETIKAWTCLVSFITDEVRYAYDAEVRRLRRATANATRKSPPDSPTESSQRSPGIHESGQQQ